MPDHHSPRQGAPMSPETYSLAELARAILEIKATLSDMNGRLRSDFVPREAWDQAWAGLAEWKAQVAADIVNLEAGAARDREAHEQAHRRLYDHVDRRVSAERADRVGGQRWAIGLGITSALGLIGTLLTVANMAAGA